jgi:hypothetical protein
MDDADSNGAIAIQLATMPGPIMVLRGPDIDPPARAISAVRIRYQWSPDNPSNPFAFSVSFDATNSPAADRQPQATVTLRAGSGWQEIELRHFTPLVLDVRYVYFWTYGTGGRLKIDAITFVT